MYTEITFSMNGQSSAPHRVGAMLVPQAAQYLPRWVDRDGRSYVTLMVKSSIADEMIAKVRAMHPSVRCISRDKVVPASPTEDAG
jgi:hypothetical protein